jgi:Ca2+/H+ antiporter
MDIKALMQSAIGVVVGVIMLTIADKVNSTAVYNSTLTTQVMTYVPTLFGVGILIGSVAWAINAFNRD